MLAPTPLPIFDWQTAPAATAETISALKGVPFFAKLMLRVAARIEFGAMGAILPSGEQLAFRGSKPGPNGVLILHDFTALRRVAAGGSLGFAEAYMDGQWDSPDVSAVLELVVLNGPMVGEFFAFNRIKGVFDRLAHMFRRNSKKGSQRNIHAHYDLGNSFYEKWLDETMTYSSALYTPGTDNLAQAQTAKYRALADMIALKPGDRVLEIGCGWGGFAEYAARERGALVTGLTISQEQLGFAQQRMQKAGIADKVDIRFQDYRDVSETFDKVASIEMFEAVGERYWPVYFDKVSQILKPGGTAGLQIITIEEQWFQSYRSNVDFIQKYVFPGGMLPSLTALKNQVSRTGLTWQGHTAFGEDYARTLIEWRDRFLASWGEIRALGFDERFKRLWNYYLNYCAGGFRGGSLDVVQLALAKA